MDTENRMAAFEKQLEIFHHLAGVRKIAIRTRHEEERLDTLIAAKVDLLAAIDVVLPHFLAAESHARFPPLLTFRKFGRIWLEGIGCAGKC